MSNKNNEPSALVLLIVTLICGWFIYQTLPNYFLHLQYRTSTATISGLDSTRLTWEYRNAFDGQTYAFQRELSSSDYQKIRSANTLTALYPRYFPEHAIVEELDKRRSLIVTILIDVLILVALYRSAKHVFKASSKGAIS